MEKIWFKSYHSGVPETVNVKAYCSLVEFLDKQCQQYAHRPAFSNFGKKITYSELCRKAHYFAAYLQKKLQLKKGDRVALMMPNILQYPIAVLAALKAGLVIVNVNPLYTKRELVECLGDAEVKCIIVLENFMSEVEKAASEIVIPSIVVLKLGDCLGWLKGRMINFILRYVKQVVPNIRLRNAVPFTTALDEGEKLIFEPVNIKAHDIAFLQYTGGTTGKPKGVILSHQNLIANIQQMLAWIKPAVKMGQEVMLGALPLYHIFSLTVCCFSVIAIGAECVLITNPRDIKSLIQVLHKKSITILVAVNTLLQTLLDQSDFKRCDFSKLKLVIAGGMATVKGVADRWKKETGVNVTQGYGLTEASPVVTINPLNIQFNGSIGLPIPETEISIRNDKKEEVDIGHIGELYVKGPQVTQGYWKQSQAALDPEGWLHTGDMVRIDERGFVYLVDRKKEIIVVSGFNVYPKEVEMILALHPRVKEVAVLGVPDEKSGEAIKAYVVIEGPVTQEALIEFCRKQLVNYKVPKHIEFRDSLPKSAVGKVLKRQLVNS